MLEYPFLFVVIALYVWLRVWPVVSAIVLAVANLSFMRGRARVRGRPNAQRSH